jgi:hypothetical protein
MNIDYVYGGWLFSHKIKNTREICLLELFHIPFIK